MFYFRNPFDSDHIFQLSDQIYVKAIYDAVNEANADDRKDIKDMIWAIERMSYNFQVEFLSIFQSELIRKAFVKCKKNLSFKFPLMFNMNRIETPNGIVHKIEMYEFDV